MKRPITDPELLELLEHYGTHSAIRQELDRLRERAPRLEMREQLEQNLRDRANLNRLLLELD